MVYAAITGNHLGFRVSLADIFSTPVDVYIIIQAVEYYKPV